MRSYFFQFLLFILLGCVVACNPVSHPTVAVDAAPPDVTPGSTNLAAKGEKIAIFAGGCFWGVEAVFGHVMGVIDVKSGYSGGSAKTANYNQVSDGNTGHAEAVQITYDPSKVTYEHLLQVFVYVAHDPTELNRQGPDVGTQYRSAIFYTDDEQKRVAKGYVAKLNAAKAFTRPVVTQIVALEKFYDAEAYHQDYLPRNLDSPYIIAHDLPKLENLRKRFPDLYVKK